MTFNKRALKILLIQLKRAGDVLMTTPAAAVLHDQFPEASVDFLTDRPFAPLLEANPAIHEVKIYDRAHPTQTWRQIRAARYDWIFDFQSSPRSAPLTLASGASQRAGFRVPFWKYAYNQSVRRPGSDISVVRGKMTLLERLTGPLSTVVLPQLFLTSAERDWASQAMVERRPVIGLVPTHRRASRRWPRSHFERLAAQLIERGHAVWVFWGPGEREDATAIELAVPQARAIPATSFREMAALFSRCELVVTNDNGPMHLAASVGTPTLTIYGPTHPLAWNHDGPQFGTILNSGLSCLGCEMNVCPFAHECMRDLPPQTVLDKVIEHLAKFGKGDDATS